MSMQADGEGENQNQGQSPKRIQGHSADHFTLNAQSQLQIGDRVYHNYHYAPSPSPSPVPPELRYHNKYFDVPREPIASFTGRKDILEELQTCCLPSEGDEPVKKQKRFVLYGLGGSGKTQTCLKFAAEHREKFWGVFWVDASSIESIEAGLADIGRLCNSGRDFQSVKRWLSNVPESWLLVFDNADDLDFDLVLYFPVGSRGTVLITTRNEQCQVHATVGFREFGGMHVDDAIDLLLLTSGVSADANVDPERRAAAVSLVDQLGCLALAIFQAGGAIRQRMYTLVEYESIFRKQRKKLLQTRTRQGSADYQYTAFTTWEISVAALEREDDEASTDAIELLTLFSFFNKEGITETTFQRAWKRLQNINPEPQAWFLKHQPAFLQRQPAGEWDSTAFRSAVLALSSFSLITHDQNDSISIHPLVHAWAHDRLLAEQETKAWISAISTISVSIPFARQAADHRYMRSVLRHVEENMERVDKASLDMDAEAGGISPVVLAKFALVLQKVGKPDEAVRLQIKALKAMREIWGERQRWILVETLSLAAFLAEIKDAQNSLKLIEFVLEVRKTDLGESHIDTLECKDLLGTTYAWLGRYEDSIPLQEEVYAERLQRQGQTNIFTLMTMSNLADAYSMAGRRRAAVYLSKENLKLREHILEPDHPDISVSKANLAEHYGKLGDLQEAVPLTGQAVESMKKTHGSKHPYTLVTMDNLASFYRESGRAEEAIELDKHLVRTNLEQLGLENVKTLKAMQNLGNDYFKVGLVDEAIRIVDSVIEPLEKTSGKDSSELVAAKEAQEQYRKACSASVDSVENLMVETQVNDGENASNMKGTDEEQGDASQLKEVVSQKELPVR